MEKLSLFNKKIYKGEKVDASGLKKNSLCYVNILELEEISSNSALIFHEIHLIW